jgi:hypothetical protein
MPLRRSAEVVGEGASTAPVPQPTVSRAKIVKVTAAMSFERKEIPSTAERGSWRWLGYLSLSALEVKP